MEENQKKKFVCKYCNKKYPCGKSLGGHIRTHMMSSSEHHSSQSKVRTINDHHKNIIYNADGDSGRKRKRDSSLSGCDNNNEVFSASENPIYGLRENPKKTTRFVHSNNNKQEERFCKECGKGFLSLKALCGHMACHSEKDKGGFCEKQQQQKLVMDSQSDTETSAQNHPRRSRRMRFKTVNSSNNNSNNNLNSSSVSEVEQEQEEIARCLMLLSKDSSYKGPCFVLPPPTESSDNNSVVLEAAKSLSNGRRSSVSNGFEEEKKKKKVVMMMQQQKQKDVKLKKSAADDDDEFVCFSDNSDSGYFRNGPKKLDSDVSVDGSREFKTPRVEFRHEYDAESRKKVVMLKNRGKTRNMEPRKLVLEDLECDTTTASRNNNSKFINSKKRSGNYDLLISRNNNPIGVSPNEGSWKQESSLNSEKFINGGSYDDDDDDDSAYESDESSTDTDAYPSPKPHVNAKKITSKSNKKKLKSKKSRDHECPICYKIFRSGQALGGHKRSHFIGGSEDNTTLVIKQGPCLIDLNLPAPMDD